jgi:sialic acid synthase SpsE
MENSQTKVEIIADIGKNFIDSSDKKQTIEDALTRAKRLAFWAKQSGVDVAKFQVHILEDEKRKRSKNRWQWIKQNEDLTPFLFWEELKEYCDYLNIKFLITPMSELAARKVDPLVGRWKVGSADITDFDLLGFLKETGKPIIVSTGMSTLEEIDKVVEFLGSQIQYLNYCVSIYPCPVYKIDLGKVISLKQKYKLPVGFSDHSLSVEIPALAVRVGAEAIEKHFTLDRNGFGPDHKVSLLPEEFKKMVELCRLAEKDGESFEEEKLYWKNFRIKNNQ